MTPFPSVCSHIVLCNVWRKYTLAVLGIFTPSGTKGQKGLKYGPRRMFWVAVINITWRVDYLLFYERRAIIVMACKNFMDNVNFFRHLSKWVGNFFVVENITAPTLNFILFFSEIRIGWVYSRKFHGRSTRRVDTSVWNPGILV